MGVVSATDLFPPSDEVAEVGKAAENDKGSKKQHKKTNSDDDADVTVGDTRENEGAQPRDEEKSDSSDDA